MTNLELTFFAYFYIKKKGPKILTFYKKVCSIKLVLCNRFSEYFMIIIMFFSFFLPFFLINKTIHSEKTCKVKIIHE